MTLADLRSSIEAEGIPSPSQNIYHNGQLVTDNSKTLQELNISDGDMLALHVRDMRGNTGVAPAHREPQRRQGAALSQDPELIRLQVLGDARLRGELERANPHLAAALENPQRFAQIFRQSADHSRALRRRSFFTYRVSTRRSSRPSASTATSSSASSPTPKNFPRKRHQHLGVSRLGPTGNVNCM
ncbi:uncharacterized protein F4822DRAFT_310383 [Hypoxylon trugodes]|uniref:uncharacterized protein n=1 Tax=Hypoxylon trugodes TaxID=326681 RepID=UPI002195C19B|nr:uncharacterized protein F4822DRAFT_310383 [Hypoxylon trugodes]KAI1386252.1 hypothetical protein F4822DRAFT_310383 [Hypoxylon trugodes]